MAQWCRGSSGGDGCGGDPAQRGDRPIRWWSGFSNVVQRTAAAFGVAVFTAIVTLQRAQQMAGRVALVPADTPTPNLGPTAPPVAGLYATYQHAQLQVFAGAVSDPSNTGLVTNGSTQHRLALPATTPGNGSLAGQPDGLAAVGDDPSVRDT